MEAQVAVSSLLQLISNPGLVGLMLSAALVGMIFGVLPGVGGKTALVMTIPFLIGMDPLAGAVLLVSMHAVVHTGGAITAILLGIPGGPESATVLDGYPLAQQGQAGRAIGASLSASAIGGVIGALFLAIALPLVQPLVLSFGPAEMFLLCILGITFMAAMSGDHLLKGLIAGCFGLLLAFVGLNPQTGEPRYVFNQLFLWDGVDVVTAMLGLFALPEVIALGVKGGAITAARTMPPSYRLRQVIQGMAAVREHWRLTLNTSVIGALIGMIPGLGGDAAAWICYGHAVQRSKTPQRFGKGAIEGVIAPETANNSKEGGALLPTLFFGVPGSSGMALMLGAFVMLGIQPGPQLMTTDLSLVWTLIWALAIANLMAVALFLLFAHQMSLITHIPAGRLIPIIVVLALLGSLLAGGDWQALLLMLAFAVLGHAFKVHGWPRAPIAIGLVLGATAENSFHQAMTIWGTAFLLRPTALAFIALIAVSLGLYVWRRKKMLVAPRVD